MEEKMYTSDLSGHCNESTAWQILKETSETLIHKGLHPIDPYCIEIRDDGHFSLDLAAASDNHNGFDAPETTENQLAESGSVWSLGATVFFIAMGCQVMNGKGGKAQHESSKLPYMRSALPLLSETIQQCLHYHPESRPSLQKIHDLAVQWFDFCNDEVKKGPKFQEKGQLISDTAGQTGKELDFWPEAMQQGKNE